MTKIQNQSEGKTAQDLEKGEAEKDRLMRAMTTAGTFEVECVNCGEAATLASEGLRQSDPYGQREYVKDGIFRIKGDPTNRLCKEAPVLCSGCGLAWSAETLRIKDAN